METTKEKLFTVVRTKDEAKKAEDSPILVYIDTDRITRQESAIKSIIPHIQTIYNACNQMPDFPKITNIKDIRNIIGICNPEDSNSGSRLRQFFIDRGKNATPLVKFGNRDVKFEAAVKSGLIEIPGLDTVFNNGEFCFKWFRKKVDTESHTWEIISLKDEKIIFNNEAFEEFKKSCSKYAVTPEQKEKYKLLSLMLDCENELIAKKHISPFEHLVKREYVKIAPDGSLIVNHGRI